VGAATKRNQPVLVIAHRGASAVAPGEHAGRVPPGLRQQGSDFVELDVQESADGQVLVVHDSDLMKIGRSPLKIWEAGGGAAAQRWTSAATPVRSYASERVPTLAEALGACRRAHRMVVELKSYGHAQHLRGARGGDRGGRGMAARTASSCPCDHAMVRRMKALRPGWRCGVLAREGRRRPRRPSPPTSWRWSSSSPPGASCARRTAAGRDVYVWTLNDPADMLGAMSRGVDGLITDTPRPRRARLWRGGRP
jgi:glycerophosphoryl diester phosphodiesterase